MSLTNTLIHNTPSVEECELNTTKDNGSFFLVYSKLNEYSVGCEYTLKRKGKFPRYECRKCRSICDKDRRSGINTDTPAAVSFIGSKIKDILKLSHHVQCRVEFSGEALARSQKNAAVVFKSKYGGTSKQAYDKHTQILQTSGNNLTATDVAHGTLNTPTQL